MKRSLLSLAFGTFALGVAEFGMMGILGDVARGVDVDIVKAGHLISAYSLGVAVGAPMLVLLRRTPLKRLMMLLAAVIALGNAFAALSPGYVALLSARFVSGLPHGAYFGAGAIVCSRLADPGKGASAVAVMVGGMTVANLIGVPFATWICAATSWRVAFAAVSLIGLLTFAGVWGWMPKLAPLPDTGLRGQFRFLRRGAPWLIYGGVFFGQASVYCWLSYVEPTMTQVARFPSAAMTWIMMLCGLGMVVGNIVAGRLADRHRPSAVCCGIALTLAVVMTGLYFAAPSRFLSLPLAFVACAGLFGLGGPLQYLIVRFAKGGEMLGGAGIQISFNVSNAMSAAVGGACIHAGLGLASPALAGVPFALVGALCLYLLNRRYATEGA